MSLSEDQFGKLMSAIQTIASDVSAIKLGQHEIRSELLKIDSVLLNHSEMLSKHSGDIEKCQSRLTEHSSNISKCQGELAKLNNSYSEIAMRVNILEEKTSVLPTACCSDVSGFSSSPFNHTVTYSNTMETIEKIRKSHNLIISALPESPEDVQRVKEVVSTIDPTSCSSIVSVSRLGQGVSRQPRLIKVAFNNMLTPKLLLRNKGALRTTGKYKKVTIREDKTLQEMRFLDTLRGELKTRQAAGERDITIKYVKGVPTIVSCPSKN